MAGLEQSALRVRRYELGSAPYQALLRDYLCGRLSLDLAKAEDVALADAIIRTADSRFAYVSFLADRREVGQASTKNISALAAGSGLYRLWLANLEREYGRKQAEAIRQVLALLVAMEEAHAWVFGEGRKVDPATGGALTPLPEQFAGVEISLLARLLDFDRPQAEAHDRIDPGLLLTLQMLQGVLWVSRAGEGTTRFRLALKEFLPAAKDDPVVGPMLKLMQARIAARALDAADQITADDDQTGEAWALLEPLTPLLEALVHLSGSEPIAQRWKPADLVSLLVHRDDALRDQGHALWRVPGLTLIAALELPPSRHPPESLALIDRQRHSIHHRVIASPPAGPALGTARHTANSRIISTRLASVVKCNRRAPSSNLSQSLSAELQKAASKSRRPKLSTLRTHTRQLDYANNSFGSGRSRMTRIVGNPLTFTSAIDSCSMTASTGASNSYLNEPAS
jgi:hypothetical protein